MTLTLKSMMQLLVDYIGLAAVFDFDFELFITLLVFLQSINTIVVLTVIFTYIVQILSTIRSTSVLFITTVIPA